MLLLSSTTYAVEMSKSHNPTMQMTTMSKAEAIQMLKDAGVEPSKIKMLENGEMAKTEGEWFFTLIALFVLGTIKAANAPTRPNQSAWDSTNGYPHAYSLPGYGYIWNW